MCNTVIPLLHRFIPFSSLARISTIDVSKKERKEWNSRIGDEGTFRELE